MDLLSTLHCKFQTDGRGAMQGLINLCCIYNEIYRNLSIHGVMFRANQLKRNIHTLDSLNLNACVLALLFYVFHYD